MPRKRQWNPRERRVIEEVALGESKALTRSLFEFAKELDREAAPGVSETPRKHPKLKIVYVGFRYPRIEAEKFRRLSDLATEQVCIEMNIPKKAIADIGKAFRQSLAGVIGAKQACETIADVLGPNREQARRLIERHAEKLRQYLIAVAQKRRELSERN